MAGDSRDPIDWRRVAEQNWVALENLLPDLGNAYRPVVNIGEQYLETTLKAIILEETGRLAKGHGIDDLLLRLDKGSTFDAAPDLLEKAGLIESDFYASRYPDDVKTLTEEDARTTLAAIDSVLTELREQGFDARGIDLSRARSSGEIALDERAEELDALDEISGSVNEPESDEASRKEPAHSEASDHAIIHGFDRAAEFRKRRADGRTAPPEADIVVVRKGEPGPDGEPVAEDMVFAVAGDDGSELGRDLLKTVADEADGIIDGSASTAPSVTAWISDHDLRELAELAERPANGELYDLLAGTRERSDEAVYDPLTERLFLGYAGRDEPTVNEYAGAGVSVGGMIEAAARAVAGSPAPEDVYVFDDDFLLAADIHLAAAYDLESAEGKGALRERMEALPDTWSRPAMAPITRCSVVAVARACLAEQGRDEAEIYERASELAGFDREQAAPVAKLLQAGFTADEIRRPDHGITEVSEGQMAAIMEAFGQAHFGDPGENSRADHEMAGLMRGRYLAEPNSPDGCYRILDNRSSVFDTQAMRTHVGAILYLDAIGDVKDGKIEVNDWLHEVDGAIAERPELADVYHMWDALCEGEAKRAFSGMSAKPLEGPTAFADLWQGDAAQAARPLQVISALRDMADRHESAPLICGAILAFADEGVDCRQDHERTLVRAIAETRANPYGERFADPIEEALATMRREVVPEIAAIEGRAAGLGALSEEKVAEAEQGAVVSEPVDRVR